MFSLQFLLFAAVLYLLTLVLVALWSDISDDFFKEGHWFGDAVLLLFWDVYFGYALLMRWLWRRIYVPSWLINLFQTLSPNFVLRAGAYAAFRREERRKGGRHV